VTVAMAPSLGPGEARMRGATVIPCAA
jgi:hypothetical protein